MKFFEEIWKTSQQKRKFRYRKFNLNHPKSFKKCLVTFGILQGFPIFQPAITEYEFSDSQSWNCYNQNWKSQVITENCWASLTTYENLLILLKMSENSENHWTSVIIIGHLSWMQNVTFWLNFHYGTFESTSQAKDIAKTWIFWLFGTSQITKLI